MPGHGRVLARLGCWVAGQAANECGSASALGARLVAPQVSNRPGTESSASPSPDYGHLEASGRQARQHRLCYLPTGCPQAVASATGQPKVDVLSQAQLTLLRGYGETAAWLRDQGSDASEPREESRGQTHREPPPGHL